MASPKSWAMSFLEVRHADFSFAFPLILPLRVSFALPLRVKRSHEVAGGTSIT